MVVSFVDKYIKNPTYLMNVTLEITSKCNLKCCHCYICNRHSNSDILPTLDFYNIEKIINEALELKAITITLTGGEPMMHPQFLDIIKFIKTKGFIIFLKTNGVLINNENVLHIKKYVDNVILSRYGYSCETYEAVTGVPKSYSYYCKAIDLLNEHKIPFKENIILLKENESEIESFIASNSKIEQYISVHNKDTYAFKHKPSDLALYKYYYDVLNKSNYNLSNIFSNSNYNKNICNCCTASLTIKPDGEIVPCTNFNFSLGNIKNNTLKNIWDSDAKEKIKGFFKVYLFKKCVECDKNKYLLSIAPCNNFTETGDINDVSEEMCRHCRIVERVYNERISEHM